MTRQAPLRPSGCRQARRIPVPHAAVLHHATCHSGHSAASAGVHIQEDKALVELLAKIPVGQEIPAELYQTIAEILAFVYSVNNRYKKTVGSTPDHRPNN